MFTQLTADEVQNAEEIEVIGGHNKVMDVCVHDGLKFVRVSKSELDDVNELFGQSRSVTENNLVIPSKLRSKGVKAPKTRDVGDYVVMEYIDGETVASSDTDVDTDELADVLVAMLEVGIQDANPRNVIISDDGLYAIDFDWAGQDVSTAVSEFENSQSQGMDDELVEIVLNRVN